MSNEPNTLSRREFTALSLAAGVIAAARTSGAPGAVGADSIKADVLDADVQVITPAGVCDAALVHPAVGAWPGVILFTDVFGLRPTMRDIAKRLASQGYTVLVPNPFYRTTKPPGLPPDIDFSNLAERAKIDALRAPLTGHAVMQDAVAYVNFLDARASVDKTSPIGAFGYCMGGPMTLLAAAANPGRIGAGASFHGRGLVSDGPDSPHLLVPAIKAQFYIGIAINDHQRQPEAAGVLEGAFKHANLPATIEVYDGCLHGWCIKDTHRVRGMPVIYREAQAEHAWSELLNLFERARVGRVRV